MTRNEEEDYLPESVRDLMAEEGAGWSAAIREYLFFQKRRRLGLLHLIENQGGEVWFYPRAPRRIAIELLNGCEEGSYLSGGRRSMKILLGSNKILIFRHDIMDHGLCQLPAPTTYLWIYIHKLKMNDITIHPLQMIIETFYSSLRSTVNKSHGAELAGLLLPAESGA